MTEHQKRIGLIGLSAKGSWASRAHLPYLQKSEHYKISALQNSSKASAEAAAKEYKLDGVTAHDDPKSIASDPNVDIVAISVKVPEHYKLVRPALEAGKDVFCEWPLARNLAEAEELVSLAKEKAVRTLIGLQARQSPSILKAKEIVASGKIGKIMGTTMYGHGGFFGPTLHESMLYAVPIEAGANILTIPFGHAVDALCYVLGEIRDVAATLANHYPRIDLVSNDQKPTGKKVQKTAHDYVNMTGTLVDGGGVVDVTYAPALSRLGRDFYWLNNGSEGTLVLEGGHFGGHVQITQPTVKLATADGVTDVEVEKAATPDFNVGKAWDAWAGVGSDQGYTAPTWDVALLRHKMIDAIYRSAERGTKENYV